MPGYAITQYADGTAGYRAVASEADLLTGETFATEPPSPSLDAIKSGLCMSVDAAADASYAAIGGSSPGRLAEYQQAKSDALAFQAGGYVGEAPATISCWAQAKDWTDQQACDDILSTAAAWEQALVAIRSMRLSGKADVNAASDAGSAQSAADSAIASIRSIPSGVA